MKAAIVLEAGQTPVFRELEAPVAAPGESRIVVTAAAISQNVKSRASGEHYSSSKQFPFVVGIDGVGRLDNGKRVYFVMPRAPYGSMAEQTVVPASHCLSVPDDLDDATAAAIANPGMSSWAAYTQRAKLKRGETVLVNGATGTAGRLAVQIARHLGAKRIIATGRNVDALTSLERLGADVTIPLIADQDALDASFSEQFLKGVDVVIDYLWGKSAERLLIAAAKSGQDARPIRFIQVGSLSGQQIILPSAVLRSSAIELMGSGIGSLTIDGLIHAIGELLQATVPGGFAIAFKTVPFSDFEQAWPLDQSHCRTVFNVNRSEGTI